MSVSTTTGIEQAVMAALKDAICRAEKDALEEAKANFETRLRREMGAVTVEVARYFDVTFDRDRIVIQLKVVK